MRPTRDQVCMEVAKLYAQRSTCNKNSGVGVVIARDGRIMSVGYNGAPAGLGHCDHQCTCKDDTEWWTFGAVRSRHADYCEMNIPCTNAVHAECNAIAFAARYAGGCNNADLYTTYSPCLSCAQLIVNAGISRVVFFAPFRDERGLDLLKKAGVQVVRLGDWDAIAELESL